MSDEHLTHIEIQLERIAYALEEISRHLKKEEVGI